MGKISISFVLLAAFCASARAQDMVEYGRSARRASTSSSRAQTPAKGIEGVWNKLDKALNASPDHAGSQATPPGQTARRAPVRSRRASARITPAVVGKHEDPRRIQPGIGYAEVIRRCGPAAFEVTSGPGRKTLAYPGKDGDVDVEFLDGKVTKVSTAKLEEIAVMAPR